MLSAGQRLRTRELAGDQRPVVLRRLLERREAGPGSSRRARSGSSVQITAGRRNGSDQASRSGRLSDRCRSSPNSSASRPIARSRPGGAPRTGSSPSGACSPTSASPTCCSTCPTTDEPLGGGRAGPPGHRPDDVPDRLGRLVRQRQPRRRCSRKAYRRTASRSRARSWSRTSHEETRMLAIPVVCDGRPIAVLTREWIETHRASPRRARTRLRHGVRPVRADDRRAGRSRSHSGSATRARHHASATASCGSTTQPRCSTSRRTPTRHCIASASRPRRSGCASPSSASTTGRCDRRSSAGSP